MKKVTLTKKVLETIESNKNDCVNCKKCFNVCPMMKEYSDSPKALLEGILEYKKIDKNIPYSCMLCNACYINCPKEIDLKTMFFDIRKDIMNNNKNELKEVGHNKIKFHQINSFSPIFSKEFIRQESKTIFFPGCSLLSYSPKIVDRAYDYLKSNIDNLSIVFECCAKPTLDMGDSIKFNEYYSKLDDIFKKNNIKEIIVACPNCYNTLKANSAGIKITPIWNVIKKYGVPNFLQNHYKDLDVEFTLHDPCPIRSESEIHENVRDILRILGINFLEFEKNKENTECCGSGGMTRVTSNQISVKQTQKRIEECKSDKIIAYCESCCESMISLGKETLHVLDFMFNDEVINKKSFTQKDVSFINKWANRYRAKKELGKKHI